MYHAVRRISETSSCADAPRGTLCTAPWRPRPTVSQAFWIATCGLGNSWQISAETHRKHHFPLLSSRYTKTDLEMATATGREPASRRRKQPNYVLNSTCVFREQLHPACNLPTAPATTLTEHGPWVLLAFKGITGSLHSYRRPCCRWLAEYRIAVATLHTVCTNRGNARLGLSILCLIGKRCRSAFHQIPAGHGAWGEGLGVLSGNVSLPCQAIRISRQLPGKTAETRHSLSP